MKRTARPSKEREDYTVINAYQRGKFLELLVDNEDSWLDKYFWSVDDRGYARARVEGKYKYVHRIIMGEPEGKQIDHLNLKLDNRKKHLRIVTNQQNQMARKTTVAKSGYKGVYPNYNKWQAKIKINSISVRLGSFNTKEEAALAYNQAAIKLFKEYASLNVIPY